MSQKKRTEITIETKRLVTIKRGGQKIVRGWCGQCGENRSLLTIEYTALLSGISHRQLFRYIESGRLHFSEVAGKSLLCLTSLCELMPQTKEFSPSFLE
jgi:hypothetical protein